MIECIQLYKPHAGQKAFHADASRFRVLACGRRWGKTIACVNEIVSFAWGHPGTMNWWVAPVYEQAEMAMDMILNHFPDVIEYSNRSKMMLILKNKTASRRGAEIRFKSAEKMNNLRGWGVDFLVMDEAAYVKEEAWVEALRPTLSDKRGRAVFIGTPQGKNWFFDIFKLGMDDKQDNYASFKFSSQSNPHFPPEEWEEVKEAMPDTIFLQEYEAEFLERAGSVYVDWDRRTCVVPPFEIPPNWYIFAGVDFGYTNPFSVVWIAIDEKGVYWVFDEYYQPKRSMNEHIASIKGRGHAAQMFYGDASGPQFMNEMSRRGLFIAPANRDVLMGINRVAELLKTGRLKVFENCQNVCREFEVYQWEPKKRGTRMNIEKPLKVDDHAMDAIRYAVIMTFDNKGKSLVPKQSEIQRLREAHFKGKASKEKYAVRDALGSILK